MSCRRNSEPDYVNVPSKQEALSKTVGGRYDAGFIGGSYTLGVMMHGASRSEATGAAELEGDDSGRGNGTLRVRDHISPGEYRRTDNTSVIGGGGGGGAGDYANAQEILANSNHHTSASFYSNTLHATTLDGILFS